MLGGALRPEVKGQSRAIGEVCASLLKPRRPTGQRGSYEAARQLCTAGILCTVVTAEPTGKSPAVLICATRLMCTGHGQAHGSWLCKPERAVIEEYQADSCKYIVKIGAEGGGPMIVDC